MGKAGELEMSTEVPRNKGGKNFRWAGWGTSRGLLDEPGILSLLFFYALLRNPLVRRPRCATAH